MPPVSRTVLIVGGGIAGLSAAYGLAESATARDRAIQCTLVEAEPRLGGKILTEQVGGFVIEGGPDSFLSQKPWGIELCRRLGLADRVIGTNRDRRKTYVYSRGRLEELPEGLALGDRKSTRLNSSHLVISYAVFCLKKKKKKNYSECAMR